MYQSANIPTAKRSVPREKTAANMNERLRERNAELEKQKEARRVVVVDDESMLSVAGKNGKGKGKKAASVTSESHGGPLLCRFILTFIFPQALLFSNLLQLQTPNEQHLRLAGHLY